MRARIPLYGPLPRPRSPRDKKYRLPEGSTNSLTVPEGRSVAKLDATLVDGSKLLIQLPVQSEKK